MPVDENTRLRLRQYLIELMDEATADAMMESMPPIPWTELATKADITRLDGRVESLDRRVETLTGRVDQTSSDLQELTRVVAMQGASLGARIDGLSERLDARIEGLSDRHDSTNERIDTLSDRVGDLGRTLTVGFLSMALTLAVFMIGTLASLFAAGAFD